MCSYSEFLDYSFPMSFTSDLGLDDNNISRGMYKIGTPTGSIIHLFFYYIPSVR